MCIKSSILDVGAIPPCIPDFRIEICVSWVIATKKLKLSPGKVCISRDQFSECLVCGGRGVHQIECGAECKSVRSVACRSCRTLHNVHFVIPVSGGTFPSPPKIWGRGCSKFAPLGQIFMHICALLWVPADPYVDYDLVSIVCLGFGGIPYLPVKRCLVRCLGCELVQHNACWVIVLSGLRVVVQDRYGYTNEHLIKLSVSRIMSTAKAPNFPFLTIWV